MSIFDCLYDDFKEKENRIWCLMLITTILA